MIPNELLSYLETQRIGVIAVEMPDGSPHAATVHFAHTVEPFMFYFETYKDSRKAENLVASGKTRASFVVGSNESEMKTFQTDGILEIISEEEKEIFTSIYLGKFPTKNKKAEDAKFLMLKFTPTWWRFTDFKAPNGKLILLSE